MTTVGLIGLGLLGSAMAKRFIAGGYRVIGYDVSTAARDLALSTGVEVGPSAGGVFEACKTIVLSLPTSDIVASVLAGNSKSLDPQHLIIDTTTGDPDQMAEIGAMLAGQGVQYLDATIAASSAQVAQGDCVVMCGGTPEMFEAIQPLLATFARQSILIGPCGAGARMKLVVNLMLGLSRAALAESLAFAGKCGLDRKAALDVLLASNAYSRVMDTKGDKMLSRQYLPPQGRLSQHLKDVTLILEVGRRVGASMPLSTLHRTLLEQCEAAGFGGHDNSSVLKAFEELACQSATFAHLTLPTRDVEKTARFFEQAMRWPRVPIPDNTPKKLNAAWVQMAPGQQIHILYVADYEPSRFETEFGRHCAVFHPLADFPDVKKRLVLHGATLVDPIRPTPFERFFFHDPNGYMFEVIAAEQYMRE